LILDYPVVTVLIITFKRFQLAKKTIESIKENLEYPNLRFHIADDGSGPEHIQKLFEVIGNKYPISVTNSERGGLSKNTNMGIEACLKYFDYYLQLQDDFVLTHPLDLKPSVQLLAERNDIGMVRLGRLNPYMSGTVFEAINRYWWLLKRKSDTYVYTENPHLCHKRFPMTYGKMREDLKMGHAELEMCSRFNNSSGPEIVWPAWLSTTDMFQHIGDSQSYHWVMEREGKTAEQASEVFEQMDMCNA
jgi:glycosyltransferase involved in cell wall biosynthesis